MNIYSFYKCKIYGDHDSSEENQCDKEENKFVSFVSSSHGVDQLISPTKTRVHGARLSHFFLLTLSLIEYIFSVFSFNCTMVPFPTWRASFITMRALLRSSFCSDTI